jgi:DNA helicase-2/ATP-dependent DNA helicase PcrA
MYKSSRNESDAERLENLAEMVSSARDFEDTFDAPADPGSEIDIPAPDAPRAVVAQTPPLLAMLRAYLERVTLVADADSVDPSQGAVTLMTLHAAKGLEFPAAAIIGLEENTLPHSRSAENNAALEEERRLFFVGITRAMRHLLITCARSRTFRGQSERTIPSRFLSELPREHVQFSDQASFNEPGWDDDDNDGSDSSSGYPLSSRGNAARVNGIDLHVDDLVRHPQFGVGRVASITNGRGSDARAQIHFRDVGTKTLVLQYARLERL